MFVGYTVYLSVLDPNVNNGDQSYNMSYVILTLSKLAGYILIGTVHLVYYRV